MSGGRAEPVREIGRLDGAFGATAAGFKARSPGGSRTRRERQSSRGMVAGAITIWTMFSLWIIAPHAGLSRGIARVAGILCVAELVALLMWSYLVDGCIDRTCAPVGQAVGVAARTDIPALAAAFLVFVAVRWRRAQPAP